MSAEHQCASHNASLSPSFRAVSLTEIRKLLRLDSHCSDIEMMWCLLKSVWGIKFKSLGLSVTLISNLMAPILQLFDFDYSDSWLNCNPRTWDYFKYTVQGQSVMDKQTACESSITVILLLLKLRLPHVYLFIFSNKHFKSFKCKKPWNNF